MTLPKGIREATSGRSRSTKHQTLDTPQRYPRAGNQSYPSPAAEPNADGSTTVYFSPKQPEGVKRGNWIQTDPNKGWFTILRLYSPLDRSSRSSGARARSRWFNEQIQSTRLPRGRRRLRCRRSGRRLRARVGDGTPPDVVIIGSAREIDRFLGQG